MGKKKVGIILIIILLSLIVVFVGVNKYRTIDENKYKDIPKDPISNKIEVPEEYLSVDKNNNGIADPIDISNDVKKQFERKIKYVDEYYSGGYPPDDKGVCTDVIWRALRSIDVNLKDLVDNDIAINLNEYYRIEEEPDPNIDFRRVPNLKTYFDKNCSIEVSEIKLDDINNLKEWQPGDIILFLSPYEHVGIVTDERDDDGDPYVIHNARPEMTKSKLSWFNVEEMYHYRWKY